MSLTKQHFIAIADILKRSQNKEEITERLICYCKTQNKNFDEKIFRKAVFDDQLKELTKHGNYRVV